MVVFHQRFRVGRRIAVAATALSLLTSHAFAADQVHDEIQVYNADIADVGQWTYQQHLNFAFRGQTRPEFPGAFVSNHSLQGTPEFAYGLTPWWEFGFYAPFGVAGSGHFFSDGAKIRNLFVVPDAAKRDFFCGVSFELGYETPHFAQTRLGLEIRPIIGVRNADWEVIANPIVDLSFGSAGEADFAPALRVARKIGDERFVGLEYYADFGKIGNFLPGSQQSQQLFAVADFPVGVVDLELGIGHGFTQGSDGWVAKAIIGYNFPAPGKSDDAGKASSPALSMGTASRASQAKN